MQADALIQEVTSQHGRINGITNCVGSIVLKSAHTTSDAEFDEVRDVPVLKASRYRMADKADH